VSMLNLLNPAVILLQFIYLLVYRLYGLIAIRRLIKKVRPRPDFCAYTSCSFTCGASNWFFAPCMTGPTYSLSFQPCVIAAVTNCFASMTASLIVIPFAKFAVMAAANVQPAP